MTDKIIRVKIEAGDSEQQINSLDQSMRKAGATADNLNDELLGLSNSFSGKLTPTASAVSQAVGGASDSLGNFSRSAGQAGMQVQQLVGQITAGTNPLVAFSQQAADIGFVLGAPLLGAVIGIAAALGSVLLPSLLSTQTEAEKLDEALKNLKNTSGQTEDGVYKLNERIVELAKVSEGAAKVRLAASMLEAKDAASQAGAAISDAFNVDNIQYAVQVYRSQVAGLADASIIGATRKIGEEFGLQGEAATKFGSDVVKAVGEIEKSGSTASFDKFINLIAGQTAATGTKQTTALAGSLLDFAYKGRQAAVEADNAQASINNLGLAIKNTTEDTTKIDNSTESLVRRLKLQNIALKDGELAAQLQAAAWASGKQSVSELDEATKKLVIENYNLKEAQDAATEAQRKKNAEDQKAETLAKEAERRAVRERERINERIANMQLEAQTYSAQSELMRAVEEGRFSQEEAALASRTAARILAANNEFNLLMENKAITDEQKELAEAAHLERLAEIRRQYADGQALIDQQNADAQAQYAQQLQAIQLGTAANALSAMSSFAKQGSGVQKALFLALKGVQAAQAYTSGLTAAMLARATIPYPASEPIALAQITAGKVSAAAIMATGLAGAFGGGGSVGSIGGGSMPAAASSTTLPTTPQSAPMVGSIEILGLTELKDELRNQDGMVSTRFVASILDKIEDTNRLRGNA